MKRERERSAHTHTHRHTGTAKQLLEKLGGKAFSPVRSHDYEYVYFSFIAGP